MSTASSVQVAQYGIDNKYVKGEPSMTFFKSVIKKHTNYSTEAMAVSFDAPPRMGAINTITIPRNGDLIRRMYMKVYYPEVINNDPVYAYKWCSGVGQALVEYAELYIGGERIQRITDVASFIQSEMRTPDSNYPALQVLENRYPIDGSGANQTEQLYSFPDSGTFYTNLNFYFNWHDASAIPLCALKYQEVKIKLKFRNVNEIVQTYNPTVPDRGNNKSGNIDNNATAALMNFTPVVEYVFLDVMEQERFTSGKQLDCIIEQTQQITLGVDTNKTPEMILPFTGMVKEIILTARSGAGGPRTGDGNNYYNFYKNQFLGLEANSWYRWFSLTFNSETIIQRTLNGGDQDIQQIYFKWIQPMRYHTRVSGMNFYSWSFAENPESLDPTGAANFSRIRAPLLRANVTENALKNVFATTINIYRICDGIGALVFKE